MKKGELVGGRVTLRMLCHDYIDAYLAMFSPIIRSILYVDSVESERAYLLERLEQQLQNQIFFYCIFDTITNQLIGAIEIRSPYSSRGQLYCWMNEQFWGASMFRWAIKLAVQSYFKATGRLFLNAKVDVSNKRSYFALKRSGFADIGISQGPHDTQYELILRKKI